MYNLVKIKNMSVKKVDLTVSQLINDLNEGLTWFKKDDLGYGSIETKYGANQIQIAAIKKHPSLKDAETNITIFNIIDDTKNETITETQRPDESRTDNVMATPVVPVDASKTTVDTAADMFSKL